MSYCKRNASGLGDDETRDIVSLLKTLAITDGEPTASREQVGRLFQPSELKSNVPPQRQARPFRPRRRDCAFCKKNGEPLEFVRSHALKIWDRSNKAYKVICPILRSYVCRRCGATGDEAHTYSHCPIIIKEYGHKPKSLFQLYNESAHDSSGRRRDRRGALPDRSSAKRFIQRTRQMSNYF